ncbi:MAG: DUF2294 domain-containing protein [Leptolyngbyaceae cyanobacterium SL_5_9]|nr:DUF2294 domain-containing protein [Leptolyngbyaceae cyanobacterium SL_5_9]
MQSSQSPDPTRGQLERTLSQRIQALYRTQLGHRPDKVTCNILGEKLMIVLEEAITQAEQLLSSAGREDLAEQVHFDLDKALQPQLAELIEEVLGVSVTDLLSDAKLETGRTGMIAILEAEPQVREPSAKAKLRKQTPYDLGAAEA